MRCIDLALGRVPPWLRPFAVDHVVHAEARCRELVATLVALFALSNALAAAAP